MGVKRLYRQILSWTLLYQIVLGEFSFGYKLRKICKDSIEILSNQGVHIEPYHRSHVVLKLVEQTDSPDKSEFVLNFDFKTTSSDGILFYGRSRIHRELIALILVGGDLIYKIQCPTLHADILLHTRDNTRLNDGQWHRISYTIKYHPYDKTGTIEIDGHSNSKQYLVSCSPLNTLVMGGYSKEDVGNISNLEQLPGHFEGCIRNVFVPVPLRSPPKYYAVSVCD